MHYLCAFYILPLTILILGGTRGGYEQQGHRADEAERGAGQDISLIPQWGMYTSIHVYTYSCYTHSIYLLYCVIYVYYMIGTTAR